MAKEEKINEGLWVVNSFKNEVNENATIKGLKQKVVDRTADTKIQGKSQLEEGKDTVGKINEAINESKSEQLAIKEALKNAQVARKTYNDAIAGEIKKLDDAREKVEYRPEDKELYGDKVVSYVDSEENAIKREELRAPLTELNKIESDLKKLSKQSKEIVDKDIEVTKKELKKELKSTKEANSSKYKNDYGTSDVEKKNNLEKDISAITKISVKRKAEDIGHKLANSGIAKEIKEGVKEIKQKVKQAFTR